MNFTFQDLNPSNIGEYNKNMENKGKQLIAFLADWCGHCQNFKPTWEKFQNKLKCNKQITENGYIVTCSNDMINGLPSDIQKPEGFPSVYLYNGKEFVTELSGDRSEDSLKKLVENHMLTDKPNPPKIVEIPDDTSEKTENKEKETGNKEKETGNKEKETGNKKKETGNKKKETGKKKKKNKKNIGGGKFTRRVGRAAMSVIRTARRMDNKNKAKAKKAWKQADKAYKESLTEAAIRERTGQSSNPLDPPRQVPINYQSSHLPQKTIQEGFLGSIIKSLGFAGKKSKRKSKRNSKRKSKKNSKKKSKK